MADRIQARALDRVGALLRQIPKQSPPGKINTPGSIYLSPREQARIKAGLSKKQKDNALQINGIPRDQFESLVESDNPPSAKKLAQIGTKKRKRPLIDLGERTPKEFAAATQLIGVVDGFANELNEIDVFAALRGCDSREFAKLKDQSSRAIKSLQSLQATMRGNKWSIPAKNSRQKSTKQSKVSSRKARQ
jgi:hypothetical protein